MPVAIKNDKLIDTLSGHFVKSYSTGYGLSSAISMYLMLTRLRGFWPFSSFDNNGDLYDLSGQGRVMTNNNTVAYQESHGLVGYADFVRANSEYFSRPDEPGLSTTSTMALLTWCWFDTESTGNTTGVISKWDTAGGNNRSYALYKTNTDLLRFSLSDDGTTIYNLDSTVTYAISQWYCIACLYKPSTYMKIFVNGTWTEDTTGIPASINDNAFPLYFGRHDSGNYLDGRMTLAALWRQPYESNNHIAIVESIYQHTRALFGVRS